MGEGFFAAFDGWNGVLGFVWLPRGGITGWLLDACWTGKWC